MGNALRQFIDDLPPVINVTPPITADTGAIDLFNQAVIDANANATKGVVTTVEQETERASRTIAANVVRQRCGGEGVCSNIETMFGSGGCRKPSTSGSGRCEPPIVDEMWDEAVPPEAWIEI